MKKITFSSTLTILFIIVFSVGVFLFSAKPTYSVARVGILVPTGGAGVPVTDVGKSIWDRILQVLSESGSKILNNVLTTTINQMSYDYATQIASGGPGQTPTFEKLPLSQRLINAADSAAGKLIEDMANAVVSPSGVLIDPKTGKATTFGSSINLCAPDSLITGKILLGLASQNRPELTDNNCTFNNLKKSWQSEYDQIATIVKDKSYLQKLGSYFDPGQSDLSVAMTLFGQNITQPIIKAQQVADDSQKNPSGWIDVTSLVSGGFKGAPGSQAREADQLSQLKVNSIGKYTGNVLIDASNIFLNQLALTAFNKLMRGLGALSSSNNSGGGNLNNPNAQVYNSGQVGIQNKLNSIVQATFSDQTDYDILSQLISCPNNTGASGSSTGVNKISLPGPTNCVITNDFSTAITKKMTVINAINGKLLDGSYAFGFKGLNNEEPPYNQGYPYRSLVILRKYRIIPVGWELAAQYIQKNNKDVTSTLKTDNITLMDLINCFDPCDEYTGYNDGVKDAKGICQPKTGTNPEGWCTGLVDPNWVLKVPKMYCGAQGYGPEIQNSQYNTLGKFCSKNQDKACVGDLSVAGCSDTNSCCDVATEGTCENKTVLSVTRNGEYCADEQSCIKENTNGSCAYYGYCTEEKRRWVFSQDNNNDCEAINNTCQTFTSQDNKTVSYLENTLDYGNCNANQVGCQQYATGVTSYATETQKISWNTDNNNARYFNKNVTDCDPSKEGCHEFIRTKDDLDTNLIADGSFENSQCISNSGTDQSNLLPNKDNKLLVNKALAQVSTNPCQLATLNSSGYLPSPNNRWYIRDNSGSIKAGITNVQYNHGSQSLYVEGAGGLYSKENSGSEGTDPTILPDKFNFEDEQYYTLSAEVYVVTGTVSAGFGSDANGQSATSTGTDSWQNLLITYYRPVNGATDFYIQGTDSSAKFYIDSVKLSVGAMTNTYTDYFANNVIYEKLLPNYLEAICYEDASSGNYQLKTNAPSICNNFVRKCNNEEVGCVQYTNPDSGIDLTAKVKPKDTCPETCLGYDVFVEQPTDFAASRSAYFIPATAKTCAAQAAGCTAFTNLDKLSQGGEAVENYSYLRTCIKPDVASCGEFYTWEGSDESGYQLKVFSLKKNNQQPASNLTPEEENLVCNESIFNKLPTDPGYNYDCRQFYSQDGTVSYHLYTETISCSDNCHPYRREVTSALECTDGKGTWDTTNNRCLYYAVPGEGTTCSAEQVGCREYTGNIASNTHDVLNDTFDEAVSKPLDDWTGGTSSNTSLNLGGHSILGSNFSKLVGTTVTKDLSYTISFLAKTDVNGGITIADKAINFTNKDSQVASFATGGATINSDWKLYTFNLDKLDHEVTPSATSGDQNSNSGEKLNLDFSTAVYLDNIKVTEIPNRYYVIKDSWATPDECDQTVTGAYSLHYMLGCSAYQDADGAINNLHSFSQLCQTSAAGCEKMVDTQNSSDYKEQIYNDTNKNGNCDTNEPNCVKIQADKMINVVYDKTKQCDQTNKGCQRFGLTNDLQTGLTYTDVYKLNDPDNYNTSLCTQAGVGCQAWSNNNGSSYFKDPGDKTCEYRQNSTTNIYGWYKVGIKHCGGTTTGKICQADTDCAPQTCRAIDDPCPVSVAKTIGIGGTGNKVEQPTTETTTDNKVVNWAGLCEAEQTGCTEYVDPISKFNNNLLINPDYVPDSNGNHPGWSGINQSLGTEKVEANTLYLLKGDGAKISVTGDRELIYQLNPLTNQFDKVTSANFVVVPTGLNSTEFFITKDPDNSASEFRGFTVIRGSGTTDLRQAIIGYQLKQNVDRTPVTVDFKTGKVLFNERSVAGINRQNLIYNADVTINDSSNGNPPSNDGQHNANVILQVSPDRSCDKWLSCRSYGLDANKKQTCFDIGLCDSLSPNGECDHFIDQSADQVKNNLIDNTNVSSIANLTGYSKVGYSGNLINADMYNLAAMKQTGSSVKVQNGSFENISDLNSWSLPLNGNNILYKSSDTQNITNPDGTLPDGMAILELTNKSATQNISLSPNTKYIISLYVYKKSGNASIDITNSQAAVIKFDNTESGRWIRESGQFTTGSGTDYKIVLNAGDADAFYYFDDVRIEPELWSRCSDANQNQTTCSASKNNWYTASSCRLYPKADSLACTYDETDTSTTQKGWRGYCLEWDPQNNQSCLLWYPLDRIASDGEEEGAGLNLKPPFDYCVKAEDTCSTGNNNPDDRTKIYCTSLAQTDTTKYFRTRLQANSNYVVPRDVTTPMTVDLGFGGDETLNNDHDPRNPVSIPDLTRSNDYKADTNSIINLKNIVYYNNCNLSSNNCDLSFFPLYTSPLIHRNQSTMCVDNRGFSVTQVNGGCQSTKQLNIFSNMCNSRNGNCPGPWSNDGCKMAEIWSTSNPTRYDTCNALTNCQTQYCYGASGNGKGQWGYEAFDGGSVWGCPGCISPEVKCGFYTKQFSSAATSSQQAQNFVERLFPFGQSKSWNGSSWGNSVYWAPQYACYQGQRSTYNSTTRKCTSPNNAVGDCLSSCDPSNDPSCTNDYCYVLPQISNIKVGRSNATGGNVIINGGDYVDLKFNSKIDPDQLPLVSYNIDWYGDRGGFPIGAGPGTLRTYQDGADLYDRPNEDNPHSFSAYLNYDNILNDSPSKCNTQENKCTITPIIKITDNWGYYKEIPSLVTIIINK